MQYHHIVSGLSSVQSIKQYDYDSHIEAWLLSRIKVVGPYADGYYRANVGNIYVYGHGVDEAKAELMAQLGY